MKKIILSLLFIIIVYFIIRLSCCFTLLNVPYIFGTNTYVGGNKYDFPICIVNSLKVSSVKKEIINHIEQILENAPPFSEEEIQTIKYSVNYKQSYDQNKYFEICHYENIKWWFHDRLNKMPQFNIVSVNTDSKNEYSFLLQAKDNPEIRCIAFIDKKTKQKVRIAF